MQLKNGKIGITTAEGIKEAEEDLAAYEKQTGEMADIFKGPRGLIALARSCVIDRAKERLSMGKA